ncbi:leucyl aminopeptidase [Candidatus Margulisiibacteriota bacterium]
MIIKINTDPITKQKVDCIVIGLHEGTKIPKGNSAKVNDANNQLLTKALTQKQISGKGDEIYSSPNLGTLKAHNVMIIGMGKKDKQTRESLTKIGTTIVAEAKKNKYIKIAIALFDEKETSDIGAKYQYVVEGLLYGNYENTQFSPEKKKNAMKKTIESISIIPEKKSVIPKIKEGIRIGTIIGENVNDARKHIDGPSNVVTPSYLVQTARKYANKYSGLKCSILKENDINKLKMGGIKSVAQGSSEKPFVIVMKWLKGGKNKKTIGLVGKGITFDSGGISLKPSKGMWEMKSDMSGAALVLETMRSIAALKLKENVIAVIPTCENLPSGKASRPGDVITHADGQTSEIISTDAEGRMILAEGLLYAQKLGAKKIIDIATLTGACIVALGDIYTGLLGTNSKWTNQLCKTAKEQGEKCWELPLDDDFKEYLKSDIADMKNASESKKAGTISGGMFLKRFIKEDTDWIHCDIAGTAYRDRSYSYQSKGATGVLIKSLIEFLQEK